MEYRSTILKILNIEKSEVKHVLWIILYSFFLGTSIAFFFTGSTSLFLSSFEREMISLSFVIAGIIVIVIGQIYSYLQKKYHFSFTITSALAFLLLSVIAFFVLFSVFKSIILIFALYAWNRVIAYIHNVVFWGMAGKLFSLQQSKRVLGLITGGEVIGLIVAFFSTPFLLKILNTEDLILISGITLLIGFFILLIITRKFSAELDSVVKKKIQVSQQTKTKKTSFLQNRYYKLFFVIAFVPIFAQFFVDYLFQAQTKVEYPSKESLTAFVGIFFGFSSIVEFILKTFISGRLMSRYGMKLGLLAFPVVMAISLVLATMFGFIYGAVSLFFSFIALGRMFTRAVRASFNDPAIQLLYQPLPPDERASFQNKVESGPKAYASIVVGLLLLIFAKIPGLNLVYFSLFLLIVTILWAISAKEIYKEYRSTLQNILSGKKTVSLDHESHPIIQKIEAKIKSGNLLHAKSMSRLSRIIVPIETDKLIDLYPELLEQDLKNQIKFSTVIELSKSEKAADRIIALRHMYKYSIYKVEKPLIRLLHDNDYEVKCEAIVATAKMKETELFYHLVTLFQSTEYKTITSGAIVNIGAPILSELDHNFQKTEYDIKSQIDTVELLEQIGGEKVINFLKHNINHHNKSVNDRIIEALGNLKYLANNKESMAIWQNLENEIKNYVFVASAIYNLTDNIQTSDLCNSLELAKREKKNKIFVNLSVLYDPFAMKMIAESLESTDKNARGFAIEVADMVISDLHKPYLMPLFECDSDAELLQRYMPYFPTEKLDIVEQLIDVINSEYWVIGLFAKASALKLLSSFSDSRVMPILIANMVHPRPMIWQLSTYCIYKTDKKAFNTEIHQNFPKVAGLKEFATEIESIENGSKILIYDMLFKLKAVDLFREIAEEELIEIATSLQKQVLEVNSIVPFNRKSHQYIIVLEGSLKEIKSEKTFGSGNILCPYLQSEDEQTEYIADIQKTTFVLIDMHMVNSLVAKHKGLSNKLIEMLWKNEEKIAETAELPSINGIINVY